MHQGGLSLGLRLRSLAPGLTDQGKGELAMSNAEDPADRSGDGRLLTLREEIVHLAAAYRELDEQRAEAAGTDPERAGDIERQMEEKAARVREIMRETIATPADTAAGVLVKVQVLEPLLAGEATGGALVRSIIADMKRLAPA